jgi:uncharacterized membrane protein YgcG
VTGAAGARSRGLALAAATLLALALLAPAVRADERILSFQSDVQVLADGALEVIETITVRAEGRDIKRGIYRDFPTVYRDRFDNRVQVRFEVISVRRNGAPEAWFTKSLSDGVRVYMGRKDVQVAGGEHRYELTYRTHRQLGYFQRHDELYWNVTGNGWAFPIDRVLAYVYLPRTLPSGAIGVEAYTGRQGARGQNYEAGIDEEGVAWFQSTRPLAPGEGLTVVVTWPKGHVREPTSGERLDWFLADNGHLLAGVVGVAVLLAYYLLAWVSVGRDPLPGVLFPRYEPPPDYSPAAMRYVRRMGYDDRAFTAAVVNLAVKGHLRIVDEDGNFRIERDASDASLAPGEKALRDRLLRGGDIELAQRNHSVIRSAMNAHRARLWGDYERIYFKRNLAQTVIGILISLAVLGAALLWAPTPGDVGGALFITVWLTGWSFGTFTLLAKVAAAWRGGHGAGALFLTVFAVPFVLGWFAGAGMAVKLAGPATVALVVTLVGVNALFYHLMKAPTLKGRELMDEVDGFLEYLSVAEADEMRLKNPPARTPELFERYLPYAIALDVEAVWGERFEGVLAAARRDTGYRGPGWYHGTRRFSPSALSARVGGGLAGRVASSSRAPGSSSGSGGGGSSGGGGGGGGGGGW